MSDGRIDIDTSINDKGFNDGMKDLDKSAKKGLKSVVKQVASAGSTIALTGIAIFATLAKVVAIFGIGAVLAFMKIIKVMAGMVSKTSDVGRELAGLNQAFDDVKGSLSSLVATLLPALIPTIMKIVDWMIKWLNILSQVIALLSGQTTYRKYIMGSYKSDVQAIEKAAKGALAAFDDINVLAQDGPQQGAFGTPTGMAFETVPVDEAITDKTVKIVQSVLDILETIDQLKFIAIYGFNKVFEDLGIDWTWQDVVDTWDDTWLLFKAAWEGDWNEFFGVILPRMLARFSDAFDLDMGEDDWRISIAVMAVLWSRLTAGIKEDWDEVVEALTWEGFLRGLRVMRDGIASGFVGMANSVIGTFEGMINSMLGGIQRVIDALNQIPLVNIPGVGQISIPRLNAPRSGVRHFPKLATGAVIPPNSEFAAILGDQTRGRNIEAPEDLIRQIVREESGQQGSQEITINFEGTLAQLIRQLNPIITKEGTRVGKSLITGGTV